MQVQRINNNNNLCSKGLSAVVKSKFIRQERTADRILLHTERTIHYYPYFDETNKQIEAAINKLTRNLKNIEPVHEKVNIDFQFDNTSFIIHKKLPVTENQAKNIAEITGVGTNDLLPMILIQQAIAANKKI